MNIYVLNGTLTFENALMPKVTTFEHSIINNNGAIVDTFNLYHVDVYDISKVYKLTISGMTRGTYAWIFNDLGHTDKRRRIKDTDGEVEMCGKYLFVTVPNSTPATFSTTARDDIFDYLTSKGMDKYTAFRIMESVRKGLWAKDKLSEWDKKRFIEEMQNISVPEWYIESLSKVRYMFTKAHSVTYVMNAVRLMWFKKYYPEEFKKALEKTEN
jgi:hypothetical protein